MRLSKRKTEEIQEELKDREQVAKPEPNIDRTYFLNDSDIWKRYWISSEGSWTKNV